MRGLEFHTQDVVDEEQSWGSSSQHGKSIHKRSIVFGSLVGGRAGISFKPPKIMCRKELKFQEIPENLNW